MPETTRRRALRTVGAALPVLLAGCNATRDDDATNESTTTDASTTDATTATRSDPRFSTSLIRYEYAVHTTRIPGRALPIGDAVGATTLSDRTRDAIAAAVEGPRFETDDPSDQLLRDVEDLELVKYDDAYYTVSHSFTEYAVDLVPDPDPGANAAVADWESLDEDSAVRDALSMPLPRGPERPMRPYHTLLLPPELEQFLADYTHLRDGDTVYRIDRTIERQFPPYTLTVEPASERDLYGDRLVDVDRLGPESREFLERVRQPSPVPTAGWGDGSLYTDAVPRGVERTFGGRSSDLVRMGDLPEDAVLSVFVRDVQWDQPPLDVSATPATDSAGVELAVTNTSRDGVRLTNEGVPTFGVLWAVPEEGETVQLWSPAYEFADAVDVDDGTAEATDHATRTLHPGKTATETYRLTRDGESVPTGTFEARGVVAGEWLRAGGLNGPDDQFVVYPFGVRLTVESSSSE